MGPTQINGLPAHALLVHVVVVLVPLAALLVVLSSFWPAARQRLGVVTPLVALVALVSVPLTTHAGEWLEARVPADPLVQRHAELGDALLPWAIGLFLLAAVSWWLARRTVTAGSAGGGSHAQPSSSPRAIAAVMAVLSLVVAVGAVVQIYRIGDSGAKAVWHDGVSAAPHADGPGGG